MRGWERRQEGRGGGGEGAESLLTLSLLPRWSEQLAVYPRTNKQNPKKKRKVEPVATQVDAKPKT